MQTRRLRYYLVFATLFLFTMATHAQSQSYALKTDDIIMINIIEDSNLSRETAVSMDGTINMPVIGSIQVAGMTLAQVAEEVRKALVDAQYLKNPHVGVVLRQLNKPRVSVLGMVMRPGSFEFKPGETIMHAVSMAGSFDVERAGLQNAVLRRKGKDGTTEVIKIDLNALFVNGDMTQNYELMPEDIIFIPEDTQNKIYVLGKVMRPGVYVWKSNMTILNALNQAGGQRDEGTLSKVYVIRPDKANPEKPNRIEVNLLKLIDKGDSTQDIKLVAGDTLYIPKVNRPNWNEIYQTLATVAIARNTFLNKDFYKY